MCRYLLDLQEVVTSLPSSDEGSEGKTGLGFDVIDCLDHLKCSVRLSFVPSSSGSLYLFIFISTSNELQGYRSTLILLRLI